MKTSEEDDVDVDDDNLSFFGEISFAGVSLGVAGTANIDEITFFGEDKGLWLFCLASIILTPMLGNLLVPLVVRDLDLQKNYKFIFWYTVIQ